MIKSILDADPLKIIGKKVFVRVDFNISIVNGTIGEDYRIRMSIPTIDYLIKHGCKVILGSHLGRPDKYSKNYSLEPVAQRLSEMLPNHSVKFVSDCVGSDVNNKISSMNNGDVLLLENLRFHKEEENNDDNFSKELSSFADIYVNDAFSTSHRKHSSTFGTAQYFSERYAGLNLKKEIDYLTMIKDHPIKPFVLIVGGSKIQDKIGALENLLPKADKILIGGAASYTFLKAKGINTGNSPIDESHFKWVENALNTYGHKILLPEDHIIASSSDTTTASLSNHSIPDGMYGFDIGIETIRKYSIEISSNRSGTIFWNGPMGLFEIGLFSHGTINVAKSMALAFWRGSTTLIGGGDTLEAMKKAGVSESEVTHVSTGGGASLKFLSGNDMPGLKILDRF